MANDNKIQMPGMFGGLTRFDEEYTSLINLTPTQVLLYVIGIIGLVIILNIFWPIV